MENKIIQFQVIRLARQYLKIQRELDKFDERGAKLDKEQWGVSKQIKRLMMKGKPKKIKNIILDEGGVRVTLPISYSWLNVKKSKKR